MDLNFKALILTHKTASLLVREAVALSETQAKELLNYGKSALSLQDMLVLSTCNRTEIYYCANESKSGLLFEALCATKHIKPQAELRDKFVDITDHFEAVEHLFEVSMGLDSLVVGDIQISNQVKTSYRWSVDSDVSGPFLHRLMHTVFHTNKRSVQETAFRDGAASVSYATAELIEELAAGFMKPSILIVGLGEIGKDVARNLKPYNYEQVRITNRTLEKSHAIAQECGYEVVRFEDVESEILKADIIVSSVTMPTPLITKQLFQGVKSLTFKHFIDLSVPRSVEASLEELHGIVLYNIDDLQSKANEALEKRKAAIPHVRQIIEESMEGFAEWSHEMLFSPAIQKLKNTLEQIRLEEINKLNKKIDDDEAKRLDAVTKSMMQKIIKLPVLQLKAACKRGEAETLVDVLNDLFNLEAPSKVLKV
ncbi:MAG: glutamyl-tRNA reductase [Cytophagales bacterium]|nr:MAG: glutamyl-tRNA reductase [Cytophagales bacterium]TAF61738.1 MAG: glutamyl-tRNA reductase [Cytophagales bacterium]